MVVCMSFVAVSLLVLLGFFIVVIIQSMISIFRDIVSLFKRNESNRIEAIEESIQNEFPIGKECIFTGQYISHWELAHFAWSVQTLMLNCELDIPYEGGWNWRIEGLGYPATREALSGVFDLKFRGKILETGFFGHMGLCSYRIEVIEILSVALTTSQN
jgi:hypothetical protein